MKKFELEIKDFFEKNSILDENQDYITNQFSKVNESLLVIKNDLAMTRGDNFMQEVS